ncbi:ABC transporter substrate-binding protein [Hamadaea sp. NPDC051192]|uniref:ABC transporter substrate-binding protein n=1 Tax=Hamadaea sp. NPDC051192 TaxID=3154940 RepID=UPI0034153048
MKRYLAGVLVLATAVAATGCSATKRPSANGADTIIIDTSDDATTWIDNYNPFSPGAKGPGLRYIYDGLVRLDYQHPEQPQKPWLAKSWQWSDGGKTLTLALRDDVKFSDGTPLTSADVAFTLNVPLEHKELNPWGGAYTAVATPDEHTVVLTFADVAYDQLRYLAGAPIVSKKDWTGKDLATWTNPQPIGSGLLQLTSVKPQVAYFDVRADAWIGPAKVKHVQIPVHATTTFQLQMLNNELMWSGAGWPTAETDYVAKDPANHKSSVIPHGGGESFVFDTAKAPFTDVHARRAVAYAIDSSGFGKLEPLPDGSPCGFAAARYADDYLIPECQGGKQRTLNVDAAKQELAQGGWTIQGGKLTKDGKAYPITVAYPVDWQPAAPIYRAIKSQLKDNLGLDITLITPKSDQYGQAVKAQANAAFRFTPGAQGFADAFSWLGAAGETNLANWSDPATKTLVDQLKTTDPADTAKVKELALQLERIVYDQVPYFTTRGGGWYSLVNTTSWQGFPADPVHADYVNSPYVPADAQMILLQLEPA